MLTDNKDVINAALQINVQILEILEEAKKV